MFNNKIENKFSGLIYKYTNKLNKKVYIGQTIDEVRRQSEHKAAKEDSYFHRAIRKYGYDSFKYDVLFRITCNNVQDLENTLNYKEIISIRFYKSSNKDFGYNLTEGGAGQLGFKKPSILEGGSAIPVVKVDYITGEVLDRFESINKAAKSLGGDHSKISMVISGRLYTAYGYFWKIDDGSKIDISSIPENYKYNKHISKSVLQLDPESGNVIKRFNSISEAGKEFNISSGGGGIISAACRGEQKTALGYIWMFESDYSGNIDVNKYKRDLVNSVRVAKYSLDGNYIESYNTIKEASKSTGADKGSIVVSCKDLYSHHIAGGFLWRYDNEGLQENIPKYIKPRSASERNVCQFDMNGNYLKTYNSIHEAARETNISSSGICLCCKKNKENLLYFSGGYKWRYKE